MAAPEIVAQGDVYGFPLGADLRQCTHFVQKSCVDVQKGFRHRYPPIISTIDIQSGLVNSRVTAPFP